MSLGSRETTSPSDSWQVSVDFAFMYADLQHHGCLEDLLLVVGNVCWIMASSLDSRFPLTFWEPWKQRNRSYKPFMACRCRFCFHACRLAAPWLFGRLLTCYGQCKLDSGIGLQQFLSLCTLEALEEEKPHLQAIHGMSVSILLSCVQTCSTMAVWKTCCLLWVMRAGFWLQAWTAAFL